MFAEAMIKEALQHLDEDINMNGASVKSIRLAVDKTIFCSLKEDLQKMTDNLNVKATRYGTKINTGKTERKPRYCYK